MRIWPIGSHRLLGVMPAENEAVPANIKEKIALEQDVIATLDVCPLTKTQAGSMQMVCVRSASDIALKKR